MEPDIEQLLEPCHIAAAATQNLRSPPRCFDVSANKFKVKAMFAKVRKVSMMLSS